MSCKDPIERRKYHQNLYGGEDENPYESEESSDDTYNPVKIDKEKIDAILKQLNEQSKKNLEEWDRAKVLKMRTHF
jgi:hypothetical protein